MAGSLCPRRSVHERAENLLTHNRVFIRAPPPLSTCAPLFSWLSCRVEQAKRTYSVVPCPITARPGELPQVWGVTGKAQRLSAVVPVFIEDHRLSGRDTHG